MPFLTRKDYKLFVHILAPKVRIELMNVGNQIKRAYLLKDGTEMEFKNLVCCEGDSMIEVELPEYLHNQKNYCICLETEEKDPVFEPIRG